MVDNNRAMALARAACLSHPPGTGNFAHTRTHQLSHASSRKGATAGSDITTQG